MPGFYKTLLSRTSLLALTLALGAGVANAADLPSTKSAPEAPANFDPWSGFYAGGAIGYGFGSARWSGAGAGGSYGLAQHVDTFNEGGSFLAAAQGGYNYRLPQHWLVGVEGDLTFPAYPDLNSNSTGNQQAFNSPTLGTGTFGETLKSMGTVRGRVGYVTPNNWLVYATGGLAWARTSPIINDANGSDEKLLWRLGWALGGGVELPLFPDWTAKLEYMYTDFGAKNAYLPSAGQNFRSDFPLQTLRLGLNYHFGVEGDHENAPPLFAADQFNIHGQATFTDQAYGPINAASDGLNSLPKAGQGRETFDGTLFVGARLWQGAELWVDPEIDQGFGVGNTHGASGFPSGKSYKLGYPFPYARVQRYFIRQEIDLGGDKQKIDADQNIFANEVTKDRLVVTAGKFAIVDIFDTNKYANNPKTDFLNWASINTGTFDYAGDAWGLTYGAAAEWYKDRFTVRAGVFDLSAVPAEGFPNGPVQEVGTWGCWHICWCRKYRRWRTCLPRSTRRSLVTSLAKMFWVPRRSSACRRREVISWRMKWRSTRAWERDSRACTTRHWGSPRRHGCCRTPSLLVDLGGPSCAPSAAGADKQGAVEACAGLAGFRQAVRPHE